MNSFYFKINGNNYASFKVPEMDDGVLVIGSDQYETGASCGCNNKLHLEGLGEIRFMTNVYQSLSKVYERLKKDLTTVQEEDISLRTFGSGKSEFIFIKSTSDMEYISPNFGKNIKGAFSKEILENQ